MSMTPRTQTPRVQEGTKRPTHPQCQYILPDIKVVAVINPLHDDENSAEDREYLEKVTQQCRAHRLFLEIKERVEEQAKLAKTMAERATGFPAEWMLRLRAESNSDTSLLQQAEQHAAV